MNKIRSKTFFLIIGAIIFYFISLNIISFFNFPYKGVLQALLLIIIAVAIYTFTRYNLYIYENTVKDGEIIFTSKLGEAERLIANVPFDSIEYIAPFGHEALKNSKEIFRYNAKSSFSNKGMYVLVFSDEKNKLSKLTFNPSPEFLSELKENGIKVI